MHNLHDHGNICINRRVASMPNRYYPFCDGEKQPSLVRHNPIRFPDLSKDDDAGVIQFLDFPMRR